MACLLVKRHGNNLREERQHRVKFSDSACYARCDRRTNFYVTRRDYASPRIQIYGRGGGVGRGRRVGRGLGVTLGVAVGLTLGEGLVVGDGVAVGVGVPGGVGVTGGVAV